ncbi:MAG TPA: prephenate dehydratase domain-containing protein, partial [Nitriliruptoraceae bacterium]|nr:prephenate dehydratase domain-containing protein [Nitriliruptoraceae bacterium]
MTLAYLGPEGTFTETAARLVSGSDGELVACSDIQAVLNAVATGTATRGVVPIENTLEGSVRATVDALAFDSD